MRTTIAPTDLRCEYLVNPSGIDSVCPRLSWVVQATSPQQRALRQSAYRILVASNEDLLTRNEGDLWDSGKVSSSQTTQIVYTGKELTSRQRCWWKVEIWDQHDTFSTAEGVHWWEMGLLSLRDWQAQWIGLPSEQQIQQAYDPANPGLINSPYLRNSFSLHKPLKRARLYATAKGLYAASINGQWVGEAVLTPGWTDYSKRIQYQTYDVTALLQTGENVIGAFIGTGWYSGYVGFQLPDPVYNYYGSEPRLLLQLHLNYTDGTSECIKTDNSWKCMPGPIVFSDLLMGEMYDARKEIAGWDRPGFQDSGWHAVVVETHDDTPLSADCAQPISITETLTPQTMTEVTPGVFIFDMGQNMVGWVRLRVQGEAGNRVQLRFAEVCDTQGMIYTENLRAARQTDTYILKGDNQEEIFEPHFTFHGFRYVEVTGYPGKPQLEALSGQVVHSATPPTGTFQCSHPLINQLQRNIVWGQRGNFLSIPTDCPQRDERLGWMGDAQIFVRTACYNMDVAAFFSKWMKDVIDAQSAAGGFSNVSPRLCNTEDGAPGWGDAGIIVPWTIYQVYGDTRILEQNYAAMARWIEYICTANPNLLWQQQRSDDFGDWLSIGSDTPKEVMATAYFAYDALLMSRIAHVLGRQQDEQYYRTLHKDISAAFCQAYVDDQGHIMGDTQTGYVLALHMELLPEELRSLAARHLVEDLERRDWHLSTGFVGVGYLCPVLTESGYDDIAYRLLTNETFPSWIYSILHGATTIWERWDGWTEEHGFQDPGMNSFNHYSLGSVGQWLYQYVAGIDVSTQGYQHSIIRPYPGGGLTYARAEYTSSYGKIVSHWQRDDATFRLFVTIPANTRATLFFPASNRSAIQEGNVLAEYAPGIRFLRQEKDRAVFALESGSYEFSSAFQAL